MNDIVQHLSGIEGECFVKVEDDKISYEENELKFLELDDGKFGFHRYDTSGSVTFNVLDIDKDVYIQFENENPYIYDIDYFISDSDNYSNPQIQRVGASHAIKMSSDGDVHYVEIYGVDGSSPKDFTIDKVNVYYLDEDVLKKQYNELSKNQLQVNSFSNGKIDGFIHVDGYKRLMLTTIPFDPGWKAYVDGKEVETVRLIDTAFLGIYLPGEGDYNVSFVYEVPGLKIGLVVSFCGLIALLSVVFEKKLKKQKVD